jgi:hypothetical protein
MADTSTGRRSGPTTIIAYRGAFPPARCPSNHRGRLMNMSKILPEN